MLIKMGKGENGFYSKRKEPDLNNEQPYKEYYWEKPATDKYRENYDKIFRKEKYENK